MKVFLTGATGYIGSNLAVRLAELKHEVSALIRSSDAANRLPFSVKSIIGDMQGAAWIDAVISSDAIIHTAFPPPLGGLDASLAVERSFLARLADLIRGSDRTLIVTNGAIFLGDSGPGRFDETAAVQAGHPAATRAAITAEAIGTQSIRGVELRLANFVYGHGGGTFGPRLTSVARAERSSAYVLDGQATTSCVHVDAVVEAFILALEAPMAVGVYNVASEEEPSWKQLAEAVALNVSVPSRSLSTEAAAQHFDPFTAMFMTTTSRLDARRIRRELGWTHAGHSPLLWELASGGHE